MKQRNTIILKVEPVWHQNIIKRVLPNPVPTSTVLFRLYGELPLRYFLHLVINQKAAGQAGNTYQYHPLSFLFAYKQDISFSKAWTRWGILSGQMI